MTKSVAEKWANDGRPKRVLCLDGGGIRGILSLGVLEEIEGLLRRRHEASIRLCDYFDVISGTSTGAIIAAGLATGMTVDELRQMYEKLGTEIFEPSFFRFGFFRAKYAKDKLEARLKSVLSDYATLNSDTLKTGLIVVIKRLDTGSPWPLSNFPDGPYFKKVDGARWIPNGDYPLWKVVRASTAAPHFFEPESIIISKARRDGEQDDLGDFVDGGVSPHNNPSLQTLMYVTLDGYRVRWDLGADKLLLVSVGTGRANPSVDSSAFAGFHAAQSLLSLMDDANDLNETILQWLSTSRTRRVIDRQVGDLSNDGIGGADQLSYARYNAELDGEWLKAQLDLAVEPPRLATLKAMDAPANAPLLLDIGRRVGKTFVRDEDFPSAFDLPT
ncbi:MAG: patatin-like phospholipase family protein [Polyangiaceae bacterium]